MNLVNLVNLVSLSQPLRTRARTLKVYGGDRRNPDEVKRDGWKEQGLLAVAIDDDRLTWPERELVRQLGERLYGKREREARHG